MDEKIRLVRTVGAHLSTSQNDLGTAKRFAVMGGNALFVQGVEFSEVRRQIEMAEEAMDKAKSHLVEAIELLDRMNEA